MNSAIDKNVDERTSVVTCSRCGNVVSTTYRFCPACGAVPLVPRYEPTVLKSCPGCGTMNPEGANFCARCGSRMEATYQRPYPAPRRQGSRALVIVAVLALVAVLLSLSLIHLWNPNSATTMGTGEITYVWRFSGETYRLQTDIPTDLYLEYERDSIRRYAMNINDAVELSKRYVTSDEPIVTNISSVLGQQADELDLDDEQRVNFVLSFVQAIPYVEDEKSVDLDEYWRFPVETLYDDQGDCEDKSFLFASLMEAMGFDAVILIFESHAAVGVVCSGVHGSYYNYDGYKYYYCETTAEGWTAGDIPDEYGSADIAQVS